MSVKCPLIPVSIHSTSDFRLDSHFKHIHASLYRWSSSNVTISLNATKYCHILTELNNLPKNCQGRAMGGRVSVTWNLKLNGCEWGWKHLFLNWLVLQYKSKTFENSDIFCCCSGFWNRGVACHFQKCFFFFCHIFDNFFARLKKIMSST